MPPNSWTRELEGRVVEFENDPDAWLLDVDRTSLGDAGAAYLLQRLLPHAGQLRRLDMENNGISALPEALSAFTGLETLYLTANRIESIAPIAGLSRLRVLALGNNQLESIEGDFNFPDLESLFCWDNRLESLPGWLWECRHLAILDSGHNPIKDIPSDIGRLTKLEELYLNQTEVSSLPQSLLHLSNLELIHIGETRLPPEIAQDDVGVERVFSYLRSLDAAGDAATPFNEAKLLLVGHGGAGKSWLLQALQGRKPKPVGSTKGIEIAQEPLDLPHPDDASRTLHLNCWDFGGQDHYQVTHQIFFGPKAIYLLVWNPRPGFDPALEERLERIQLSAGTDATVFIVATHAEDPVTAAIGERSIRHRFGSLIGGFFEVDSKKGPKGQGIAQLSDAIARAAADIDGMDTPYAPSWIEASRATRAIEKSFISFREFLGICEQHGLDGQDAKSLAGFMDELGQAAYFAEATDTDAAAMAHEEENLLVLKPEWLAKAVTFVLEDKKTREDSGVLQHSRLKTIWKEDGERKCPGYPKKLHRYFLWLMWRYDIAYRQNKDTSLVPEMIGRNQPDDLRWTPSVQAADREASLICSILQSPPLGLVPVLTAAVHPERSGDASEDDTLDRNWRNGFFLSTKHRGEAFVELQDRSLRIVTRGDYPGVLAEKLRGYLHGVIQERWPKLRHEFRVPCINTEDGSPCEGEFPWRFLQSKQGDNEHAVDCQRCGQPMPIAKLLNGFKPDQQEVLELLRKIKTGQDKHMALALRHFRAMLDPNRSLVRRAPCMFLILPDNHKGWNIYAKAAQNWLTFSCWCEHPDGPHPVTPIGSNEAPDFRIKLSKEWVRTASPYIRFLATILRACAPVAGSVAKFGIDDAQLRDQIDVSEKVAEALGGAASGNELGGITADAPPGLWHRRHPEALREIQDVLLKHVPRGGSPWGDLQPVVTKELGPDDTPQVLWLCSEHAAIQSPPVPDEL